MKHHPYFKLGPSVHERQVATPNIIPWWPYQLCLSYGWPQNLTGGGVIGIVEPSGTSAGWLIADVADYFRYGNNHHALPVPTITDVSVDAGAVNTPGGPGDIEVALDIQVAATAYSVATNKSAIIRVYWANDDLGGIARAVAAAAADGCDVCSISWGNDEASWGTTALQQMDATAQMAANMGMITFAASGDNDSSDGGPGAANVDAPASCPYVVGCGGTRRPHNSSSFNQETVWNNNPGHSNGAGTGGGWSSSFPRPAWQPAIGTHVMRMVPDIAANADPVTGYRIVVGGQDIIVGGTSPVAPLYAGLFAAFGRKLGFVSQKLWLSSSPFNDIVKGDNGLYRAGPGPDPCTGLGSPKAAALAAMFSSS